MNQKHKIKRTDRPVFPWVLITRNGVRIHFPSHRHAVHAVDQLIRHHKAHRGSHV
jgi:hypothetical protein